MNFPIKRGIERIPGGMVIVPLTLGALIGTFAPGTAQFFGSFTGALFSGALPILAVFYVCMGTTIPFETLPQVAGKGGVLLAAKVLMGVAAALVVGHFLGTKPIETGLLAGLSTLAVVVAINDTNGGLYMALMGRYGTPREVGAYSLMSLESGPFITMMTLGGLLAFPWQTLLGAILPLAIGIALGNLDREMRDFLGKAAPALIPFFAFGLGASLNLTRIWEAGLIGLVLGLAVIAISGVTLVVADRLTGGTGVAGMAAATTAGNAAAVPALVAAADHKYDAAAGPATVLVAACVIVTAFLAPPLVAWIDSRRRRRLAGAQNQETS